MLIFSVGTYCLQLCLLNRVSASFSNGGKAQNLDKLFFFSHERFFSRCFLKVGFVLELRRKEQSSTEFPLQLVGAGARTETITN